MAGFTKIVLGLAPAFSFFLFAGESVLHAEVFYVSPSGSDTNSGTETQPFCTIGKAQECVRAINRNMTQDIVVYLRGGIYRVDQPIVFTQKDSGFNGHCVFYKRYPYETPIVSGGQSISGWQPDTSKKLWEAKVNVDGFRQIYVNDRRATRAKGKPPRGMELFGAGAYRTSDTSIALWENPSDIEFIYDNQWDHTICKVNSITRNSSGTIISMLEPYFLLARMNEGKQVTLPTSMENAIELLDESGEWYFNRSTHFLYYMPREGETLERLQVIIPALERLLEVRGTLDEPAHDIIFEGITFCHGGWNQPSLTGLVDAQANFTFSPQNLMIRTGLETPKLGSDPVYLCPPHIEAVKSPSDIVVHAAKHIRFDRCKFTKLGGGGIDVEYGSQDNVIVGCTFCDISGTAIQIGDVIDHHPQDLRAIVKNNSIVNNYIHHVAVEYLSGVGIFVGYTDGTRIAHNEICDLPYTGISIGWGWGEVDVGGGGYPEPFDYKEPSVSNNNICENNHIHDVMQNMWDGGGIYTLGNMPGSVIRGNYIHDNLGWPGGIYLDEGSGFIEVVGNVVYNVHAREGHIAAPYFLNNHRQNRSATCAEHGNFFRVEVKLGEKDLPQSVIDNAGLEPAYRDLL
jgi:hypothetical protein